MNEKKWTQGEWSIPHFASPEADCQCGYVLSDRHMGAICTVHCSGDGDWMVTGDNPGFEEAVANAHLIAAAPDLYEALVKCLTQLEILVPERGRVHDELMALLDAKAALAKARGERHG